MGQRTFGAAALASALVISLTAYAARAIFSKQKSLKPVEVRIDYGNFLDPFFPKQVTTDYLGDARRPLTHEEVRERIDKYQAEWALYEPEILRAMTEILGVQFRQNIIDVYIVNTTKISFSDPLTISANYTPHEFVDVLTHELLHRLLTDNNKNIPVSGIWGEMFPGESQRTRNHILLHAIHAYIYLEILKSPERLERDERGARLNPPYKRAWEIVVEKGYGNIINDFKKRY